MQALSMAGGMTPFAATNDIIVLRGQGKEQTAMAFRYPEVVRGRASTPTSSSSREISLLCRNSPRRLVTPRPSAAESLFAALAAGQRASRPTGKSLRACRRAIATATTIISDQPGEEVDVSGGEADAG